MTRPVKGFLTKRGVYYDKKIDAETRDAIDDFTEGLNEYLGQYYIPPMIQEFIAGHMRYFILANKDIVAPYIKLVQEIPAEPIKVSDTGPVTVPFDDSHLGDYHPMDLPEDVNDFLPEPDDETTTVNDFTAAFLDPDGGTADEAAGHEDVRHAGVPGEDPTE
jgi:hypothetical protein